MMETKSMDLLVSFDTTGSMYPVLSQVRRQAEKVVKSLFNDIPDLRIGVIAHGDYCDKDCPYTIRILDFTKDIDKVCEFIRTTAQTYGGDADECYELVLNNARTTMSWNAGSTKVFMLIGDASPHGVNYHDNKDKLDWQNEAGLLGDMGVKIFAVHALSYYRSSSRRFYETIAKVTGGTYLTLDQFDEVIELINATCMSEYNEEKLNEYVSIIRRNGKLTKTMARNIQRLSGEPCAYEEKKVQRDGLIPVEPGRFQIMAVDEDCAIKKFVEDNGITFKRGRGFYELTKHETVQQYKEVIIQDRETGEMFTGAQVREKLGLLPQIEKGGAHESLSSRDTAIYRVFVQSTSVNRKLIGGTTFLYEIDDIADTGTKVEVKEEKGVAKASKTKEEKGVTKASKTKATSKTPKTHETEEKLSDVITGEIKATATKKVPRKKVIKASTIDTTKIIDKKAEREKDKRATSILKARESVENNLKNVEELFDKAMDKNPTEKSIDRAIDRAIASLNRAREVLKNG